MKERNKIEVSERLCLILNLHMDEPFEIEGQYHSNPYVITKREGRTVLISQKSGEDIHSWILIDLINTFGNKIIRK